MTKCLLQFGTLFLFILINQYSYATHILGGNISYECTGNSNEYEISLELYIHCQSSLNTPTKNVSFTNSCGMLNPTYAILNLNTSLTTDITQLCTAPVVGSSCSGGVLDGYNKYTYTGIVVLTGPCDFWSLDFTECDRSPALNIAGSNCLQLLTTINSVTDACNNSPVIESSYPILKVCNNQPVSHSFNVVDSDGDNLNYALTSALVSGGANAVYQPGFSGAQPIPGIAIDSISGFVTFIPTMVGYFQVTVLITESDGAGNVVGTMMHDMQFLVENCINQVVLSPTGINNFNNLGTGSTLSGGNTVAMCDGDQFCLDIVFADTDPSDVLTLTTNALEVLPGATFTQTGTNPATGTLCWAFTNTNTGSQISIMASDNSCPTVSIASFIIDLDIPFPLNISSEVDICGNMVADLEAYGTAPLTWSVISGDPLLLGTNFTCNPCSSPIASPNITTVYEVVDGSNCNLTDQVTVNVVQNLGGIMTTIVTSDTVLCAGDCFNVNAVAEEVLSDVTPVSNTSSSQYPLIDYSTTTSFINVFGMNMSSIGVGSIQSVCMDIDHDFVADLDIYLVSPDNIQFLLSSDNGGFGNDYDNTCFTINATLPIINGVAPFVGNYIPEGGVLSGALLGSPTNGSWSLQVADDSGGNVGTLNSWTFVLNDNIPNIGSATSVLWTSDIVGVDGINDSTDPLTSICGVSSGLYTLTAYDVNNCSVVTDFNITVLSSGNSGFDSSITVCKESVMIDLFSYLGGTPDAGGVWMNANGDTISGLILPDTLVNGSVFEYEVFGINCSVSSFVTVNTFELTETHVFIDSDCGLLNGSITITALDNLGPVSYSYDNGITFQSSNVFDNLAAGSHLILVEDSIGCQTTFTQTILDSNLPFITSLSVVDNICNTGADGEIQVIGTNLNFYSIDAGMTTQTSNAFTGLPTGSYLIMGYSSDPLTTTACSTTINTIVAEPNPLDVYDVTLSLTSCPGDDVTLLASNLGGAGNSILTWMDGLGNILGTGNSITINPIVNTVVTVELTEGVCPSDSESTSVSIPTPIYPAMTSNINEGCYPLSVKFINLTSNGGDVVTTNWSFSASNSVDVVGTSPITEIYNQDGVFDLGMSVTSVYGCVYDTTYVGYISSYDHPVASFIYSPVAPTTNVPDVVLISTSSNDVVQWDWLINNGTPSSASTENVNIFFPSGVPGIYPVELKVWNEHGCMDSILNQIEVINGPTNIFAPNMFTPNGDAYNETWKVFVNGINKNEYHMIIYNRRGEVAWESYDSEGEWNGTSSISGKVESGTYVWIVNTKESKNGKDRTFNGTVFLAE